MRPRLLASIRSDFCHGRRAFFAGGSVGDDESFLCPLAASYGQTVSATDTNSDAPIAQMSLESTYASAVESVRMRSPHTRRRISPPPPSSHFDFDADLRPIQRWKLLS